MRSKEQFKAYVYEKADAARVRNKRSRAAWARGAVAFSLLIVVGGAFLYVNGGMTDKAMAPTMDNYVNANAEIARYAESGEPAEAFDFSVLADSVSAEDDGEKALVTAANKACETAPETMAVESLLLYSCATAFPSVSLEMDYTVAKTASEYNGDLSNIDFSKNVALVITAAADIASWEIEYGEDTIIVTVTSDDAGERDAVYTILLEKEKYSGQKIEIRYK